MKTSVTFAIERLSSTFWFVPSTIALCVTATLFGALQLPHDLFQEGALKFAFDASAGGARQLLSAVAGGVMTVVGVLFSLTVLVLQQASSQYSPRVIERFVRSVRSQVVFGFYIGTFVYCLLLIRQIPDAQRAGEQVVPAPAILLAIILAVSCLVLLIHYIHHIVHAIQSTRIILSLAHEGIRVIDDLAADTRADALGADEPSLGHSVDLRAPRRGYFRALRWHASKRIMRDRHWRLELRVIPGDYVDEQDAPVGVIRSDKPVGARDLGRVQSMLVIGESRTHAQDLRFAIRQIVDVALRALSPGINDPTTALESLDGISSIVIHLTRSPPAREELRAAPHVRIHMCQPSYEDLLRLSFEQILHFGRSHDPVVRRIDEIVQSCSNSTEDPSRRRALKRMSDAVQRLGRASEER